MTTPEAPAEQSRVAGISAAAFGVTGAIGRELNPYVARDADREIAAALESASRSVVVSAPRGAGAVRTLYEALNRLLPDAPLLMIRDPGALRREWLLGPNVSDPPVLWIDDLGAHWDASGRRVPRALVQWFEIGAWLVAVCYDDSADMLTSSEFRALKIPVVRLEADLTNAELAAMQSLYGRITTRSHIGHNPPTLAKDLPAFSASVRQIASELGGDSEVTASAIAEALRVGRGQYAGGRFSLVRLDPDAGPQRTVGEWLAAVREHYDAAEVVASTHEFIDGRLTLRALAVLDADVARALGEEVLEALAAECDVGPKPLPVPSPREHVRWLADEPVGLNGDMLGRAPVARALAAQLRELVESYPGRSFLVHIDGAWGTGKSTLMRFLRESVAQERWLAVQYDAWRQSRVGPPWLTMLHAVRTGVRAAQRGRFRRMGFWWNERARLLSAWHWIAAALLATGLAAVAVSLTLVGDLVPERWVKIVTLLGTVATVGAAWWAIAARFGRFIALDSRRAARTFTETRADPMEDLARHFAWILRRADRPVLLLVDDLDRCPENFVVELLDAVQKLMRDRDTRAGDESIPNLLVVVAADGRWIRRSYDATYASLASAVRAPGATIGSVFLEKLFQLTVPVPQLSGDLKTQFLTSLLASPSTAAVRADPSLARQLSEAPRDKVLDVLADASPMERVQVSDVVINRLVVEEGAEQETRHALEPYASLLDPTPRAMKRFVMAYSMLRAVRTAEGSVVGLGPLALWTIARTRWPLLAEYLHDHPDAVKLFCLPEDRLPGSVPAEIAGLFSDPPEELRAVMNHADGPLSADVIRECSGQPGPATEPPSRG